MAPHTHHALRQGDHFLGANEERDRQQKGDEDDASGEEGGEGEASGDEPEAEGGAD